ncbi:MAG: T9SS type A sorting domain-containing protein, partial [Bacteroidia bacterium]
YDFSGVDNSGEILGLRYSEFVVPLVKAVQELSVENEELRMENEELRNKNSKLELTDIELENRIAKMEKRFAKNKFSISDAESENVQQIKLSEGEQTASLSQNIPNPYTGKTTIQYYVPETAQSAQIKIVNANGVNIFLADVKLGAGVLEIDAAQISAGTYSYTLIVDGKVMDTKLMVIVR